MAPNGLDERRRPRIILEFLAQAAHENVHRAIEGFPIEAAGFFENALTCEHATTVPQQQCQEFHFGCGKIEFAALKRGHAG